MTVVDANYFLRYFLRPATPQDQHMAQTAATLFRRVEAGQEAIITTDAVVAEVVFILSSRRHYHLPRPDVVARLTPILRLPGCKVTRKRFVLRALDLWSISAKLSFADALGAVYAQELKVPLASFDGALARVARTTLWQPPSGGNGRT
jgi:predicted nucleic acid-binding protein